MDWLLIPVVLLIGAGIYYLYSLGPCSDEQANSATTPSMCCHGVDERHRGNKHMDTQYSSLEKFQDPICKMWIQPADAAAIRKDGKAIFHFCSEACANEFDRKRAD